MTFLNLRARALIGSMISLPPATARLPPGRKSYWISTTTRASSTLSRIAARTLLLGGGRRGVRRSFLARRIGGRYRGRRVGHQRLALFERILGAAAVAVHGGCHLGHQVGFDLGQLFLGEACVQVFLAGSGDHAVALV